MVDDEFAKITVELDSNIGYSVVSVPFFVYNVVETRETLNQYVRGVLKLDIYVKLLSLEQPETFLERSKSLVVKISEHGKKPSFYNWRCIRKSMGLKPRDLIWATVL